jgi:DNA repair protein RadA/Sms
MAKVKRLYECNECGHHSIRWIGCCPECKAWNSFEETSIAERPQGIAAKATGAGVIMHPLSQVSSTPQPRMLTGIGEWDRVVGGGIMPSSLLVLTGDPGIGKSTLLLQICYKLAQEHTVFYFSTEESLHQVKQRAERLACVHDNVLFSDNASLDAILVTAQSHKPTVIVIDSIQNCSLDGSLSVPGSVSQLREATFQLMRLAKEQGITVIITGHITKQGVIGGPKTLEHMVDAVFYLQGEDRWQSRVLRSVKNRFGTINEIGFFEMHEQGLQEVANINEYLLSEASHSPGSVLVSVVEGSRPLLLELQALTIESKISMPQRVISGIDHKQVVLIAAILQKYLHIPFSMQDIFFKVSGGFSIKSSAVDLGIALALLSSYFQLPLPQQSIALGEISLTGQIKPINQIDIFIKEAEKFGIKNMMLAHNQKIKQTAQSGLQRFNNVYELLSLFSE